jgi:hypothetical protein
MHKIMTATREVKTLCQIISNYIAEGGTSTGSTGSDRSNKVYRIAFEVPGDGKHYTDIAGHQAQEIASGEVSVTDYEV